MNFSICVVALVPIRFFAAANRRLDLLCRKLLERRCDLLSPLVVEFRPQMTVNGLPVFENLRHGLGVPVFFRGRFLPCVDRASWIVENRIPPAGGVRGGIYF